MGSGTHPGQALVLPSVPPLQGTRSPGLCFTAGGCLGVWIGGDGRKGLETDWQLQSTLLSGG